MLAVSGRSGDVRAQAAVKQDFLEADPYWDMSGIPNNSFKPKEPFTGKIVSYKPGTESSPNQGSRVLIFCARFGKFVQLLFSSDYGEGLLTSNNFLEISAIPTKCCENLGERNQTLLSLAKIKQNACQILIQKIHIFLHNSANIYNFLVFERCKR